MTSSITRYFYNPTENPAIQQATPDQNQAMRSNPGSPLKDRSHEEPFPARRASSRIFRAAQGELLQKQFLIDISTKIKAIGYTSSEASPATTGTSKPGVLCMTDGLDLCFAVAIGGEKLSGAGSKVRIFHVMPTNQDAQRDIRIYVQLWKKEGYAVRAAVHGGDSTR